MKKNIILLVFVITVVLSLGIYSYNLIKQGANAYIYAYPLVVMENTRMNMSSGAAAETGPNHLYHMREFPDHSFRNVVRPNRDTLYSIVWFDLSDEPQVISVPEIDRYYILPFMDAWTNVFGTISSSKNNGEAGEYLLAGPDWEGEIQQGLELIQSPTNMVWLIARIEAFGQQDVPNIASIQEKISITPLSDWPQGPARPAMVTVIDKSEPSANPKAIVDAMSAEEFFAQFLGLLTEQDTLPQDEDMLATLSILGLSARNDFSLDSLPWHVQKALEIGSSIANQKLHEAIETKLDENNENGWRVRRHTIGNYGSDYATRAGVAMAGLGALTPEDAVYPTTYADQDSEFLTGQNSYRLNFYTPPPAGAFWSLTLYDIDGYLVENSIDRYFLSSRDPLSKVEDGSLSILIAHQAPEGDTSNWLPAPTGEFSLTLRIYEPKEEFLDGSWRIPAVERLAH